MNILLAILFPLLVQNPVDSPKMGNYKIYIFVAETCPICQYYTKKIKEISNTYESEVVLIFPNKMSTDESVKAYMKKYQIDFNYILDKDHKWVNKFDAMITPEVFVYNTKEKKVYYQGRIDDNYARVGKRKLKIQSDDLINALESIKTNKKIKTATTQSVGCYISKIKS